MPSLSNNLYLERCPHCSIADPHLVVTQHFKTTNHSGKTERLWYIYVCQSCGNVISAWARQAGLEVIKMFPETRDLVSEDIPERAQEYLKQAIDSISAPAGAVMLAASSVDSMLKSKNYTDGNLYSRITKAKDDGLITAEMAEWAHEVRLDANDQRHADDTAALPSDDDARKSIEFAKALAEFLFVLPAKVKRGRGKKD